MKQKSIIRTLRGFILGIGAVIIARGVFELVIGESILIVGGTWLMLLLLGGILYFILGRFIRK